MIYILNQREKLLRLLKLINYLYVLDIILYIYIILYSLSFPP